MFLFKPEKSFDRKEETSLEDLGAATCKLVNFVDHKVQSTITVKNIWTSRAAVGAKNIGTITYAFKHFSQVSFSSSAKHSNMSQTAG